MPFKYNSELHRNAMATDKMWQIALEAQFGKKAGDARYTAAGKGEAGSGLRSAYDARTSAQTAWHAECDI